MWDGLTHSDFRTFIFQDFLSQTVHLFTALIHCIAFFNLVLLLWHYLFRLDEYSLLSAP
ncbi:hypothetical protein AB3515_04505 [Acinetobacter baumannii]